jgi:hypothetical protein
MSAFDAVDGARSEASSRSGWNALCCVYGIRTNNLSIAKEIRRVDRAVCASLPRLMCEGALQKQLLSQLSKKSELQTGRQMMLGRARPLLAQSEHWSLHRTC